MPAYYTEPIFDKNHVPSFKEIVLSDSESRKFYDNMAKKIREGVIEERRNAPFGGLI